MSWEQLVEIIQAEAPAACERITARLRLELGAARITVPAKARPTDEQVRLAMKETNYRVDRAARRLGVSRSTLYRRLRPRRIIR